MKISDYIFARIGLEDQLNHGETDVLSITPEQAYSLKAEVAGRICLIYRAFNAQFEQPSYRNEVACFHGVHIVVGEEALLLPAGVRRPTYDEPQTK